MQELIFTLQFAHNTLKQCATGVVLSRTASDDLYFRSLFAANPRQVFELSDDTVHSMLTMTNNSNAMDIFHLTDHMSVVHQTAGNRLLQHVDKRPFDVTSFSMQIIVWKCRSKKPVICFHILRCKQDHILSHCCLIDNIH